MEANTLNPEESLNLISKMIAQAKNNTKENSFYFLLWGWVATIANFGIYWLLTFSEYKYPFMIWMVAMPAAVVSIIHACKKHRTIKIQTLLDTTITWLWISYAVIIFIVICFGQTINYKINPIILIVSALPTLLTGVIIKFKPLMIGGFLFWILGIACFLLPTNHQFLVSGIAYISGYIIPGYLLKSKKEY